MFSEVERAVRRRVAEMLTQRGGGAAGKGESLLAGALSRALCYVHRYQLQYIISMSKLQDLNT